MRDLDSRLARLQGLLEETRLPTTKIQSVETPPQNDDTTNLHVRIKESRMRALISFLGESHPDADPDAADIAAMRALLDEYTTGVRTLREVADHVSDELTRMVRARKER